MILRLLYLLIIGVSSGFSETPEEALDLLKTNYEKSGGWDLKYDALRGGEKKAQVLMHLGPKREEGAVKFEILGQGVINAFANFREPGKEELTPVFYMGPEKFHVPDFSGLFRVLTSVSPEAQVSEMASYQPSVGVMGSKMSISGVSSNDTAFPWMRDEEEFAQFDRVIREDGKLIFESEAGTKTQAIFEEKSGLLLEYEFGDEEGRALRLTGRKPLEKFQPEVHGLKVPDTFTEKSKELIHEMFRKYHEVLSAPLLEYLKTIDAEEQEKALDGYQSGLRNYYGTLPPDFSFLAGPERVKVAIQEAAEKSFQNTLEKYLAKGATKKEILDQRGPMVESLAKKLAPVIAEKAAPLFVFNLDPEKLEGPERRLLLAIQERHRVAIVQNLVQKSIDEQFEALAKEIKEANKA